MNVAGRHITSYLVDLLSRRGWEATTRNIVTLILFDLLFGYVEKLNWSEKLYCVLGMQWIGRRTLRVLEKSKRSSAILGKQVLCPILILWNLLITVIIICSIWCSYDYKREYQLGLETTILVNNYTVSWILFGISLVQTFITKNVAIF